MSWVDPVHPAPPAVMAGNGAPDKQGLETAGKFRSFGARGNYISIRKLDPHAQCVRRAPRPPPRARRAAPTSSRVVAAPAQAPPRRSGTASAGPGPPEGEAAVPCPGHMPGGPHAAPRPPCPAPLPPVPPPRRPAASAAR